MRYKVGNLQNYAIRSVFELQKFYYMQNSSESNQQSNATIRFSLTIFWNPQRRFLLDNIMLKIALGLRRTPNLSFGAETVNTLEAFPVVGHGMAAGYAMSGDLDKAESCAGGLDTRAVCPPHSGCDSPSFHQRWGHSRSHHRVYVWLLWVLEGDHHTL